MALFLSPFNAAVVTVAGALVALLIAIVRDTQRRKGLPYPPGPPGEFLLGHLRIVPFENTQEAYLKWGKEYSKMDTMTYLTNLKTNRRE